MLGLKRKKKNLELNTHENPLWMMRKELKIKLCSSTTFIVATINMICQSQM